MEESNKKYEVLQSQAGMRLDVFLSASIGGLSRRLARKACEAGQVRVNGRREKAGFLVQPGEQVSAASGLGPAAARPELVREQGGPDRFLSQAFDDDSLLAINKRPGMHSVTMDPADPVTCADCVAAYCASCCSASEDPREAGLVQRLDFYTSGVMLAAKSKAVWSKLHQALLNDAVEKIYFALVDGTPAFGTRVVDTPLRAVERGTRMTADHRGEDARSEIEVVRTLPDHNKAVVKITGRGMRRHQVRTHLASIGFPLSGDEQYGSQDGGILLQIPQLLQVDRPGYLLHAWSVEFEHPVTRQRMSVTAPSSELEIGKVA